MSIFTKLTNAVTGLQMIADEKEQRAAQYLISRKKRVKENNALPIRRASFSDVAERRISLGL